MLICQISLQLGDRPAIMRLIGGPSLVQTAAELLHLGLQRPRHMVLEPLVLRRLPANHLLRRFGLQGPHEVEVRLVAVAQLVLRLGVLVHDFLHRAAEIDFPTIDQEILRLVFDAIVEQVLQRWLERANPPFGFLRGSRSPPLLLRVSSRFLA